MTDRHEWEMDRRHVDLLGDVLGNLHIDRAVEIGSFRGASTMAFLNAMSARAVEYLQIVEPNPTPELVALLEEHNYGPVDLLTVESASFLPGAKFDAILVDGDHSLRAGVVESAYVLREPRKLVALHDTNSDAIGIPGCRGPAYFKYKLIEAGYVVFEDCAKRPGERTERGFLLASKDDHVIDIVRRAFVRHAKP